MISAVMAYWRPVAYGLLASFIIIMAMTVMHWRARAHDADIAEGAVRKLIKDQIDADVARSKSEAKTSKTIEVIKWKTRDVVRKVKVVVHDNPGCDFDPGAIELLNNAKRSLSTPAGDAPPAPEATPAEPGSEDATNSPGEPVH